MSKKTVILASNHYMLYEVKGLFSHRFFIYLLDEIAFCIGHLSKFEVNYVKR